MKAYFFIRLLDVRRPKLFFFLFLFGNYPVSIALRAIVPASAAALGALLAFALFYFVWPMLMSKGAVWTRIVVCMTIIVLTLACEVAGGSLYYIITGFASITYSNFLANPTGYILARAGHLLMSIVTLIAMELILRGLHFGRFSEGSPEAEPSITGTIPAIAFVLLQTSALACAVARQIRGVDDGVLAGLANPAFGLFAVVVLILDFVLILTIRRYAESTRELGRAAAVQRLLDDEIASYQGVISQVEETARLRHDLRNQLQVVYALHNRGENDLAAQHFASMSRMLSDISSTQSPEAGKSAFENDRINSPSSTALIKTKNEQANYLPALSMPWIPWAPIFFQAVFSVYVMAIYMNTDVSPVELCLMAILLAAGMVAAVWLKRSLDVSTELEANRFRTAVLETQVEAQRAHAEALASQQREALEIRQFITHKLAELAENLKCPDMTDEETFDRALAAVKLLDVDKRWSINPVVDALVATKARQFDEASVELCASLDVPRETNPPSTVLCAAFSNMLDNALAAAQQVVAEGNSASVEVNAHVKNGFLIITTQNPTTDDSNDTPKEHKRLSDDASISEHGWGQGILRSLADRYNGDFTFDIINGTATTTLILNLHTPE